MALFLDDSQLGPFSLSEPRPSSLGPSQSASFSVQLADTSTVGLKEGALTIRFSTNSVDWRDFLINLQAEVKSIAPAPEIEVEVGGEAIPSGREIDLGIVRVGGAALSRTVTVINVGGPFLEPLSLAGPTDDKFRLIGSLVSSLDAGASDTFDVQFHDSSLAGTFIGVVTINSNDSDESQFTIRFKAKVLPKPDVWITGFEGVGGTALKVDLGYSDMAGEAFQVAIYRSADGNGDEPAIRLLTQPVVGLQNAVWNPNWTPVWVDVDFVDQAEDYYLTAIVENVSDEEDESDNERRFDGGLFRSTEDDVLHLHGTDGRDWVQLAQTSPDWLSVNSGTLNYPQALYQLREDEVPPAYLDVNGDQQWDGTDIQQISQRVWGQRWRSDVNGDGTVTPLDVLLLINFINQNGNPPASELSAGPPYWDVNADGIVSPADVLIVINFINANPTTTGTSGSRWQNPSNRYDVNNDGRISAADRQTMLNLQATDRSGMFVQLQMVSAIHVRTHRGDDHVVASGLPVPVWEFGGPDEDYLEGGSHADALYGGNGDDWLYGGPANDRLYGELGNDCLSGGPGVNTTVQGPGQDSCHVVPQVTVVANPNWTGEETDTPAGRFTIHRPSSQDAALLATPLTVSFNIGGTATYDPAQYRDYTLAGPANYSTNPDGTLTGTVTIPAHTDQVAIEVVPVSDGWTEGPETVTLTLIEVSASYQRGEPSAATVTIADEANNPHLTIDSIQVLDAVLATDAATGEITYLNPGQLDESEGFAIHGVLEDGGVLDPEIVTLQMDLNWDGDYGDDGETLAAALTPAGSGQWTFEYTVNQIEDDGTTSDVLVIVATVEDDDHGNVTTSRSVVVANVPPRFEEEPDLFIDYDEYDIPVRAIVFARYADRGSRDEHTVTIVWGDGPTDANIPVGDGAVAFVRDLSSTPFVDLDSLYPTGVTLRDDDNGVIFVNVQRPAVNLPRFKVSKGPHEIDMRAHNNKTTAQVTALVEQALRAKLAEIAQEQLPNVLFVYNEPTLRPQNPNVAYGEAGYVIGWKTDARLGPPLDFSGTLISYFAYYVRYEDAHIGRPLRFTSGNRVETVPTPTSTAGHETWHTDGIPGEEYNNWAQNHDIVVATTKKKMGFWKELSTSRNQVQNALRALQVGTDAAALAALNQILDQHLVGWQAGMRITNAGVWHGGLVTGSDLKQYYEYQGAWEFK